MNTIEHTDDTNDTNDTNDINDNINTNTSENKNIVSQIHLFTASSICMLNILRDALQRTNDNNNDNDNSDKFNQRDEISYSKFMGASKKYIDSITRNDEEFDYARFIKKAFTTFKNKEQCCQLLKKDKALFDVRDTENKIVTILPGIDIRFGYKYLTNDEINKFWQYLYLFSCSVFNMIKINNEDKFNNSEKYEIVRETNTKMQQELSMTGIMFNNQVFNPFIGLTDHSMNGANKNENTTNQNYGFEDMFTGANLPSLDGPSISIDNILKMLQVDKIFNENKLNDELKNISDSQINEATDRIIELLGAGGNSDIKEVCGTLIQDIVESLRTNGINNISKTLKDVTDKARNIIEPNKMIQTAESMKSFMANSQDKLKDFKDPNTGNPIGESLMKNLPTDFMNMFTKNFNIPIDDDNDNDNDNDDNNAPVVIQKEEHDIIIEKNNNGDTIKVNTYDNVSVMTSKRDKQKQNKQNEQNEQNEQNKSNKSKSKSK